MKVEDEIIADGKRDLSVTQESSKRTLDRRTLKTAQTKIELGPVQKRQLEERLEKLKSKKAKMSS